MNVFRRHALTTGHAKILVWKGLDTSVYVLPEGMVTNVSIGQVRRKYFYKSACRNRCTRFKLVQVELLNQ